MRQLPLDLALPPRFGREDYLVSGSNQAAFAAVERWPDWPDRVLVLAGPEGAGKSHLAAIWAARAGARPMDQQSLSGLDLSSGLDRPVVIEDADTITDCEAPLFHLLNIVRDQPSFLLLTSRWAPSAWSLRTPDLLSRLRLAPMVDITAPDDELMRAVLVKLFADRQLLVDESVVAYLLVRLERSIAAARSVVEALDRAGLERGRKVSRPLAGEILDAMQLDDD